MDKVRVRFAPSPTGSLHIGGVRTALYNYLLARKHGGTMILRIEDTDQNRFVPGAEDYILEALAWMGIEIDEGIVKGGKSVGPHAPYRQSERKEIYRAYAERLVQEGKAYYAFDTADELEAMRRELEEANVATAQYNAVTRMKMTNSLTLSAEETQRRISAGDPYVIRIKLKPRDEIRLNDLVRGWVSWHATELDDKVLLKSDGMPTYHLASVVDDHLMEISHVIRGEEWLPSAPIHVLLYRYFGWENTMPKFAHISLVLNPDGNGKLSKRDASVGDFPRIPLSWTDPVTGKEASGFREEGYLPDALANFMAFLGWNPGTEQEIFSPEELIQAFSLERMNKAGARFDIQKAKWYNQQYIRMMQEDQLVALTRAEADRRGIVLDAALMPKLVHLFRERITFLSEILTEADLLFQRPAAYEEDVALKKWTAEAVRGITAFKDGLKEISGEVTSAEAKELLHGALDSLGIKMGKVMQALRLAITGKGAGPDLMLIIEILGASETVDRLELALQKLQVV
jgi:glutamyl-tRNA synthetase